MSSTGVPHESSSHSVRPGGGAPPAGGKTSRVGQALVGVGVLALVATVLVFLFVIRGVLADIDRLDGSPRAGVRESTPVEMAQGEQRRIWITDDLSSDPGCVVRDAAGHQTAVGRGSVEKSLENGDSSFHEVGGFTAPSEGTYGFGCARAESVFAAPEVGSGVMTSVAGIFGALGLGGLGALSLVAGIVLWVVGASRRRSASGSRYPGGPVGPTGAPGSPPPGAPAP